MNLEINNCIFTMSTVDIADKFDLCHICSKELQTDPKLPRELPRCFLKVQPR